MKGLAPTQLRCSPQRFRAERSDASRPPLGGHPGAALLSEQVKISGYGYYERACGRKVVSSELEIAASPGGFGRK